MTAAHYQPVRLFVGTRPLTFGGLAPRSHRVTAAGSPAFSAAMWVVNGVHGNATDSRAFSDPPLAAGLSQFDVLLVRV